jgi:hypothetical protein
MAKWEIRFGRRKIPETREKREIRKLTLGFYNCFLTGAKEKRITFIWLFASLAITPIATVLPSILIMRYFPQRTEFPILPIPLNILGAISTAGIYRNFINRVGFRLSNDMVSLALFSGYILTKTVWESILQRINPFSYLNNMFGYVFLYPSLSRGDFTSDMNRDLFVSGAYIVPCFFALKSVLQKK